MKKRLNILCLLVFVAIAIGFIPVFYGIGQGFMAGFTNYEQDGTPTELEQMMQAEPVNLMTVSTADLASGSIRNEVTGDTVKLWPERVYVGTPIHYPGWFSWMYSTCRLLAVVALLVIVVLFLKLIIRVNRGRVFEWSNVRLLRWLGGIELAASVITTIFQIYGAALLSEQFAVRGFAPDYFSYISTMELSVGLVALIVAEIFAVGLKMKEEQELTI